MAYVATPRYEYKTASIANGASLSDAIDLDGLLLCGIVMPAAWTAANLTFQASTTSGGTYNNVYTSAGSEKTVTADASRHIVLDATEWASAKAVKVRSGTAAAAVNQGAARSVVLVLRSAS